MYTIRQAEIEVSDYYLQTASAIITHIDGDSQEKMLKELTERVKRRCILVTKFKESNNIQQRFKKARRARTEYNGVLDHEEILKQFKNEIAGISTDVSKNKTFLDFEAQIKALLDHKKSETEGAEDDEELVVTQKQMNVLDPVTKKRMTDPVRNTVCGHVYDRDSITALLKGNKCTKCPVVGCRNENFVKIENLQTDILTKKYLDKNREKA